MNNEQESVTSYVFSLLDLMKTGTLEMAVFDGPGGSGKTYVYRTLCHLFRGMGIKYKPSSWMGMAANLLPDGRTLHKNFALPFEMDKYSSSEF